MLLRHRRTLPDGRRTLPLQSGHPAGHPGPEQRRSKEPSNGPSGNEEAFLDRKGSQKGTHHPLVSAFKRKNSGSQEGTPSFLEACKGAMGHTLFGPVAQVKQLPSRLPGTGDGLLLNHCPPGCGGSVVGNTLQQACQRPLGTCQSKLCATP